MLVVRQSGHVVGLRRQCDVLFLEPPDIAIDFRVLEKIRDQIQRGRRDTAATYDAQSDQVNEGLDEAVAR